MDSLSVGTIYRDGPTRDDSYAQQYKDPDSLTKEVEAGKGKNRQGDLIQFSIKTGIQIQL